MGTTLPTRAANLLLALTVLAPAAIAAEPQWDACWVTHPTAPLREPIVLHFRRTVQLTSIPSPYLVHVSADNRFILYVNGRRVGDGPARGDLRHWRFETFDLAEYLKAGTNLIAATVWNYGIYAPVAQITDRTAFLVQGEGPATGISTPTDWLVEVEPGQGPLPRKPEGFDAYMASGPGDQLDAAKYDWTWNDPTASQGNWVAAASPMRENIYPTAARAGLAGETVDNYWQLVSDELPPMAYSPIEAGKEVRSDLPEAAAFPEKPVSVASNRHVHILLDRKTLTTGYPQLTVSGGKGSAIRLTYAEALYDAKQQKGDRDEVGNRQALGIHDSFFPDGGGHRTFEPLWWRTWRYLDLEIQTADAPLTLDSLRAQFSAYPFQEKASFQAADDPDLAKIWEISWRTARLDAHETYMDTPYYEQLQYIGDTRIQALISYAVAGDDRLAKQALAAFDDSRIPAGLTQSRYPTSQPQMIPTFSLLWVGMLHDYWMYRPDPTLVQEHLPGTRTVLAWFSQYEQPDGLLKKLPWWSFVDWVPTGQLPNYDVSGESCTTTLQYLGALRDSADMEAAIGDSDLAAKARQRAAHVLRGLQTRCWDATRGLLADNPSHKNFSQQTNVLAVLFDAVPKEQQPDVLKKILNIEPGTAPGGVLGCSYYFRFYLARALEHAGMADQYLASLAPWRELLPLHFSTWPETPGESRSDSHAWSAHPDYDLLTLVAGIEPDSPGFATVRIAPHLGNLNSISAQYPHPAGMIEVHFERDAGALTGKITMPAKLQGTFVWKGKEQPLHTGENLIHAD
jgi:hypothetical protein